VSDDGSGDGADDVVDAEIIDNEPGTELDVWDPEADAGDGEPGAEGDGPGLGLDRAYYGWPDPAQPTVTVLSVDDLDETIDAETERGLASDPVTSDSGPASRGGGPGGKGLGGGKLSRKDRKRLGGSGGGFTLFGFTLNVSPRLNIASGNTASVFGGRAQRKAQAARLTRGGRAGSTTAMRRRITRARWLDKALGGGR
jgi:hypothetical protein